MVLLFSNQNVSEELIFSGDPWNTRSQNRWQCFELKQIWVNLKQNSRNHS